MQLFSSAIKVRAILHALGCKSNILDCGNFVCKIEIVEFTYKIEKLRIYSSKQQKLVKLGKIWQKLVIVNGGCGNNLYYTIISAILLYIIKILKESIW